MNHKPVSELFNKLSKDRQEIIINRTEELKSQIKLNEVKPNDDNKV